MEERTIWTIGHSTHDRGTFIWILESFGIQVLADIRSHPGSRKFPHFNREELAVFIPENEIAYVHLKELEGRRKVRSDSVNTGWRHEAFRGYADYMETEQFRNAARNLQETASVMRTAIMCAEILWWRCHRSLVSDYLKWSGWKVIHIMGEGKSSEHHFTEPARIVEGRLTYEARSNESMSSTIHT